MALKRVRQLSPPYAVPEVDESTDQARDLNTLTINTIESKGSLTRPPKKLEKITNSVGKIIAVESKKENDLDQVKSTAHDRYAKFALIPNIFCPIPLKSVQSAFVSFLEDSACPPIINRLLAKRDSNILPKALMLVVPKLDCLFLNEITSLAWKPFPVSNLNVNINMVEDNAKSQKVMELFQEFFAFGCVTFGPGNKNSLFSPLIDLLQIKVDDAQQKRQEKMIRSASKKYSPDDPIQYILTISQLQRRGYPLPIEHFASKGLPEGWIQPVGYSAEGPLTPLKLLAIDCEMCKTANGTELTRISMVDYNGKTVLDELVKPDLPILDYLTEYSGMTADMLADVTTTHKDIQNKLMKILDRNTVLVGQGLRCDLKAMKLIHPYIIDTSVIYSHIKGPSYIPSLRWLTQQWLKRTIQSAPVGQGHDSIEDAIACMDLLKLKLKMGPAFGTYKINLETIFSRLARCPKGEINSGMADYISSLPFSDGAVVFQPCESDQEIRDETIKLLKNGDNQLVMSRFLGLEQNLVDPADPNPKPTDKPIVSPKVVMAQFLDALEAVLRSVPKDTLIMITSGHSYNLSYKSMKDKQHIHQYHFDNQKLHLLAPSQLWSPGDAEKLEQDINSARHGLTLWGYI